MKIAMYKHRLWIYQRTEFVLFSYMMFIVMAPSFVALAFYPNLVLLLLATIWIVYHLMLDVVYNEVRIAREYIRIKLIMRRFGR